MQIYCCRKRATVRRAHNHTTPRSLNFIIYGPSKLSIFSLFFRFSFTPSKIWTSGRTSRKTASTEIRQNAFLCKSAQATSSTFNIKTIKRPPMRLDFAFMPLFMESNHVFGFLFSSHRNCVNWNFMLMRWGRFSNGRKVLSLRQFDHEMKLLRLWLVDLVQTWKRYTKFTVGFCLRKASVSDDRGLRNQKWFEQMWNYSEFIH